MLDMRAGAAKATDPEIPLETEFRPANLLSKVVSYNVCA